MAVCALALFLFTISLNLIVILSHLILFHAFTHACTIAYIYPGMYAAAVDKYIKFWNNACTSTARGLVSSHDGIMLTLLQLWSQ